MDSHPFPESHAPGWAQHYPERWTREVSALRATGWGFRFRDHHADVLLVDYPLPAEHTGRQLAGPGADGLWPTQEQPARSELVPLEVRFPAEYPFFPPRVIDSTRRLRLRRHTNAEGGLCLIEPGDWRIGTTVADLLGTQLPRVLRAAALHHAEPGLEVRAPEPVGRLLTDTLGGTALIMPSNPIPADACEGALVVRYTLRSGDLLGAGLVERLLGEGVDIPGPAPVLRPAFRVVTFGRWARDPDFNRYDTPSATYERLQRRLAPLLVDDGDHLQTAGNQPETRLPLGALETLCLLVPGERAFRQPGEEWVAIRRVTVGDGTECFYLRVQQLRSAGPARIPQTRHLADREVVVVGVGALGGHVATDLARTGVGRLHLVDGDDVDVATAGRQHAPIFAAGRNKAEALASHLILAHPDTEIRIHEHSVGAVTSTESALQRRDRCDRALQAADLVIDATADPATTGYLAALRHAAGRDFLHVSATAGAWGGCVFLSAPASGCWVCLQHHRTDGRTPVPPADPAGLIAPPGCAETTFTGSNPDLATIAHHASRVAINRLLGHHELGGDLYVAHLRDSQGEPRPATWQAVPVPVHPDCPLHSG